MNSRQYIKNYGQYVTESNGMVIDSAKWGMNYDGHKLNLEAQHNDEVIYMQLSNNEIMKLLELPAHHQTIDKRLHNDLKQHPTVNPIFIEDDNTVSIEHVSNSKRESISKRESKSKSKRQSKTKRASRSNRDTKSKTKRIYNINRKSTSNTETTTNQQITPDYLKTLY
jgi:hypothetical protein